MRDIGPLRRDISVCVGPQAGVGMRLDSYLTAALMTYSRSLVSGWISRGYVTCDGTLARPGQRVRAGAQIRLVIPHPPVPEDHQRSPAVVDILYRDESVIACAKPVGQLSHPAGKVLTGTVLNQLQELDPEVRLVNRIDRDTSGIILACTSAEDHARLCRAMRAGRFDKRYLALCHGCPQPPQGCWEQAIADPVDDRTIARRCAPEGQPSRTRYQVIEDDGHGRYALLELILDTGRQHQIRVHAAHNGHPLIGDWVYGQACVELEGQALHAARLVFPHPRNGSTITVQAPLTGVLAAFWQELKTGGQPTPRPLRASERRRLGLVDDPTTSALPHGYRPPTWLDDDSLRALRQETGE